MLLCNARPFHNSYFFKRGWTFLQFQGSRAGLFKQLIYGGFFTPSAFSSQSSELRFPPLISYEKTAPFHQSLQKSPPSFLEPSFIKGYIQAWKRLWLFLKDDIAKGNSTGFSSSQIFGVYSSEFMVVCTFLCKPQIFDYMLIMK